MNRFVRRNPVAFTVALRMPGDAEPGQPYYFALGPGGESGAVVADPPFQVLVRENAAPGGA